MKPSTRSHLKKLTILLDIARRTAKFLGVEFHPVVMDEAAMASRMADAVWHSEAAMPDTNGCAMLAMAEMAHSHGVKVVLTGEGSDEHFGGYPDLFVDNLREPDPSWPSSSFSDKERLRLLDSHTANQNDITGKANQNTLEATDIQMQSPTRRMLNNITMADKLSRMCQAPLSPWVKCLSPISTTETEFAEGLDGVTRHKIATKWHPLHSSEYVWTKSMLNAYILRYCGDNVHMLYQVESRPAFLDHHLTEYANSIPPSLKIKYSHESGKHVEKYILREAVRPFVTDEIYRQQKKPFLGPRLYALNGPMHRFVVGQVTKDKVAQLGFIDWPETQIMMRKAFEEGGDPYAIKQVILVAQFVILAQKFGVETSRLS